MPVDNIRRALVDVDSTLWAFDDVIMPLLVSEYGVPPDADKREWEWYRPYMSDEQFYRMVDVVKDLQIRYPPFRGADDLFRLLPELGYEFIVATNHPGRYAAAKLVVWLSKYLPSTWSGVYAGKSKLFLIDKGMLVIDDAPKTIKFAHLSEANSVFLNFPWNESVAALGHGFGNLKEMVEWLRTQK